VTAWSLVKSVRVKHLAIYLVVAFVVDHVLASMDLPLVVWDRQG
jgi:hypothetical protein